jgi:hypothetical protein
MRRRFFSSKNKEYLSILALEDNTEIKVSVLNRGTVLQRINDGEWGEYYDVTVNKGDIIQYKGNLYYYNYGADVSSIQFDINKNVELFGDCTSILNNRQIYDYCFYRTFENCPIVKVSSDFLSSKSLSLGCYSYMFENCTSLVTAPELPATTLANYCYQYMFSGCTSLTTAPSILPATTLTSYCYHNMFYDCTSLTTAPALPATTLANSCYYNMFFGCTSLTTAPELPATTLTL